MLERMPGGSVSYESAYFEVAERVEHLNALKHRRRVTSGRGYDFLPSIR